MAIAVQLKFTQGVVNPPAGEAAIGIANALVTVTALTVGSAVQSVKFNFLSVPFNSTLPIGTFAAASPSNFLPDVTGGSWAVEVKVVGTDGTTASDIRVFSVPTAKRNWIIPAFDQGADAHNYGAQLRGWAGPSAPFLLDAILNDLDANFSTPWKDSVRLATTAPLPANTRTGDVLTADANGALANVDSTVVALLDDILVKNEVNGVNNGAFVVNDLGDGSSPWVMTRRSDFDTDLNVTAGATFPVAEGSINEDKNYQLTNNDPVFINVDALTFAQFGGAGGTWAQALAAGAVSGGVSPILSAGDSLIGEAGNFGSNLNLVGGEGIAGAGGSALFTGGQGSTSGGTAFVIGGQGLGGSGGSALVNGGAGTVSGGSAAVTGGAGAGGSGGIAVILGGQGSIIGGAARMTGGRSLGGIGPPSDVIGGRGSTDGGVATILGGKGDDGSGGGAFVTGGSGGGASGDGGTVSVSGGTPAGTGKAGFVEFNIADVFAERGYNFSLGLANLKFFTIGQITTAPVTASTHGFYIQQEFSSDFTFGFKIQTDAATNGNDLFIQGQEADDGDGGSATIYGGRGTTIGGLAGAIGGEGTAGPGGGAGLIGGRGSTAGGFVIISGGQGLAGDGGTITLTPGVGSAASGGIVLDIPTWSNNGRVLFREGGADRISIGAATTPPTNGSTNGFYIFDGTGDFNFGYYDKVGAGNGSDLLLIGQKGDDDDGGDVILVAGGSNSGSPGVVSLFSSGQLFVVSSDGVELNTDAKPICEAINELAVGGGNVFGTKTTTNDTPQNIAGLALNTNNSVAILSVRLLARNVTSEERATWDITVTAQRDGGGTVTILDTNIRHVFKQDAALDVTFGISGQVVEVDVTGHPSNSVKFEILGTFKESI